MASSSVYYQQNGNGFSEKPLYNGLPTHSTAVREKWHRHHQTSSWLLPLSLPIPGVRTRRLRIMTPNPARLHQFSVTRFGRRRGPLVLVIGVLVTVFTIFALHKRFATPEKNWPTLSPGDPPTLVYKREDLQRIWEWEIAAGHYPSIQKLPKQLGLSAPPYNPALPAKKSATIPSRYRSPTATDTIGTGSKRVYLDIQAKHPNVAYPPRPVSGSVADLDAVMEHCEFPKKYVRDCLEVLRIGGGLDNQARLRRGKMDDWKYIYLEDGPADNVTESDAIRPNYPHKAHADSDVSSDFPKKRGAEWEASLRLSTPPKYRPYKDQPASCDDENPRFFHMFWTGPFTDKPYLAVLSYLFTQNLGLHLDNDHIDPNVCRPKFILWISPGPAAVPPGPNALREMYDGLKSNPWASPFLHPRFKDVIEFRLWNTTEQLDGVPELKDEWRAMRESLFNSGGFVEKVHVNNAAKELTTEVVADDDDATVAAAPAPTSAGHDDKVNRVGSKSASEYDRLSVILSDMARFVLCHRFGGIYLDADTIFLRDWEELWGWRGAFAYRWSRLEKYNTAVLRMNKNSALGTFLFRTALKNGLDFHPMTVSRYTRDAYLEGLLLRLPDALFSHLFDTPRDLSAAPGALGFDGFYKGAYSYHFHNFWWRPFDPSRNWPDLGERFINGERIARATAAAESGQIIPDQEDDVVGNDKRDLDWSTVLKRTFEAYVRGERPNMYGEWLRW
ncbi:uncharacterized protein B0H18DRAFT_969493 [Fomitopsis serialis]|uniref:uncharacterized protein n=1 Tax=Fomitopsis serialis TaxID=139415 RepID=UPI00200841F8|nr:uncharacterized protein B0H18DRAFT_969493 [Neoantrodia serialis]KAH9937185.1 hypothetical protein B0H18DRAFT_969493 [Neoantrodia serialis]